MRIDQEFLLYPLGTEEQPDCPARGKPMTIALHEARKGDIQTLRSTVARRAPDRNGSSSRIEVVARAKVLRLG